jgi:hypothetical protein
MTSARPGTLKTACMVVSLDSLLLVGAKNLIWDVELGLSPERT